MTKNLKALFLDMDGVLWRDLQPIGDLPVNLQLAAEKGLQLAFITNNATRTVVHYLEIFAGFGLAINAEQIYTSAVTTAQMLKEMHPGGGNLFIVGENGLEDALTNQGFSISAENPLAVVVALDRQVTYEKLKQATLLVRAGIPFFGTNPDRTLPTPEGQVPGAGALIAAIETATDAQATIIGKPQPAMLQAAMRDLGLKPSDVLMVGDRLETDIAAGQNAGCLTALVLSGASTHEQAAAWKPSVDFIAPDLAALLQLL